jgi:autophagy-related protein 5
MPEIRKFLMDVVFDEAAASVLKEEEWWFESEEGTLLKWHWPIGLIYDNHTISSTIRTILTASMSQPTPLKLILHLASPPTDKLLLSPSAEACKQAFMGQLKEADFMRWGNTKRMTGLRKAEQDGMWEGVKDHNFDDYWRVANKITPTTAPNRPNSPPPVPPSSASMHSRPSSSAEMQAEKDGAYNVRSVPVRVYLPDGPVMQELVPPTLESGAPHTLSHYLSTVLPLLFPPPPPHSHSHSPSRVQQPLPAPPSLAYAMIQGVLAPSEAEMAWLGACMAGADGWLNVCVGIVRDAFSR